MTWLVEVVAGAVVLVVAGVVIPWILGETKESAADLFGRKNKGEEQ